MKGGVLQWSCATALSTAPLDTKTDEEAKEDDSLTAGGGGGREGDGASTMSSSADFTTCLLVFGFGEREKDISPFFSVEET